MQACAIGSWPKCPVHWGHCARYHVQTIVDMGPHQRLLGARHLREGGLQVSGAQVPGLPCQAQHRQLRHLRQVARLPQPCKKAYSHQKMAAEQSCSVKQRISYRNNCAGCISPASSCTETLLNTVWQRRI